MLALHRKHYSAISCCEATQKNTQADGEFAFASGCAFARPVEASPPALKLQQLAVSRGPPLDMRSPWALSTCIHNGQAETSHAHVRDLAKALCAAPFRRSLSG